MARVPIPDDVARFILLGIPSIPYLEAMLLLRREKTRPWDPRQIAERLYLSEKMAQSLLVELHSGGIAECVDPQLPSYLYHPQSSEVAQMIDRLAEIYAENLIDVTNLVHSKSGKKAQQFADAFIWRKDS